MKALLFGLIVMFLAVAAWWLLPPDPATALRAEHAPLARVERTPAPDLGPGIERWRMLDERGFEARGLWRPASRPKPSTWTVVMLGGLETGDRAALLVAPQAQVNVLAVDWPWSGPRRLDALGIVRQLPAIRAAVLRSPVPLAMGIESLAREHVADSSRIALLGVSLGVPPTLASLRLAGPPAALVLVHGAADLELLLRHDLGSHLEPRWLARPIAALAFRLIRPLEPAYHFDAAAGIPALLIEAKDDERLPRAAIEHLKRGLPHAEVMVLDGPHLRPTRAELIATITARAMAWLGRVH